MPKHKSKSKKQKMYRMKGCSKRQTQRKRYLGGSPDVQLAYPSNNVDTVSNTNLAYPSVNIGRAYPAQQSTGGYNFLNPQTGGNQPNVAKFLGGSRKHRVGCRCSRCKKDNSMLGGGCGTCNMSGGGFSTSNNGIPYPNGLLGTAWKPAVEGWPGVDGISMNRNHLGYNTYSTDISRQILDVGANPPYTYMKGGRKTRKRKQSLKGGTLSNFLGQDFVNLGRQFKFNAGSTWDALRGNAQTVNPLPWKDQMTKVPVALP